MFQKRFARALAFTVISTLVLEGAAFASSVDTAIVDATTPTGSVQLSPGGSGNITINLSVTGAQAGTATFDVYRDWSLSGGSFTGSNPQTFTVPPRAAGPVPATTFSTTGMVSVAGGQGAGTFTLEVGAFNITNSNPTGAKLAAGTLSSYSVQVVISADPCDAVLPPAAPVISPDPTVDYDGAFPWFVSIPTISASSATVGATIDYATEVNGGAKSAFSPTAPTLVDGTTTVYARATSATCSKVSESSATFYVDTIAPVITDAGFVSGTAGLNGWYISAVSNAFSAADNLYGSGLGSFTTPWNVSSAGAEGPAVQINSGPVGDVAGNTNPGLESAAYMIDLTDPSVTCVAATFLLNESPAEVSATVSDGISGPASSPVTAAADTSSIGPKSVSISGYDNAGRSTTVSCSYNVIWDFLGFFRPVDNWPTLNVVKAGSAVPVKFSLSGYQGLSIFYAGYPTSNTAQCDAAATEDPIEVTVTAGGSSLNYDALVDQYIYVWKTDKLWAGTCRQLRVKLADGTLHVANFKLTK